MNVELIYDRDCPNVEAAREAILRAFAQIDRSPRWTEWERSDPESPPHARACGSPTVLVGGRDVSAAECAPRGDSCRIYPDERGDLLRAPPVDAIVAALADRPGQASRTGLNGLVAALPTSGAFLLPVGACPACWPAYTALVGSLGLGFLLSDRYLLPAAIVLLAVTLATLAYRAPARRGHGPFLVGLAGAASTVVGRFVTPSEPALYLGLGLIVAAASWNAWPRRKATSCTRCMPPRPQPQRSVANAHYPHD